MKRLVLTVMFAGLLAPAGLMAQKVYIDGTSVILDLSVAAGMPAGVVTTTGKTWTGTPANSGSYLTDNLHDEAINATVYYKLEVAPHDMNNVATIGTSGTFTMDWVTAFNGCQSATYDGGGWRLPTQRELQIMYIFMPALNNLFGEPSVSGTAFSSAVYWSSSEFNAPYSWYVDFSRGLTTYLSKTYSSRVRCVRELP